MRRRHDVVLALCPNARGITYALFEGPLSPLDWGTKRVVGPNKNVLALEITKRIVDRYQPDVFILEDCSGPRCRKWERVRRLHQLIQNYAEAEALETFAFSRRDIRHCFEGVGARTRFEIAATIAARVHALGSRMPRARMKPWEKEDQRLALFDAASLVMTYYCRTVPIDKIAPVSDG